MSVCGVNTNPKQGSRKVGVLCSASATAEQGRVWRRGAGARCSCLGRDLQPTRSSIGGKGGREGAHRGSTSSCEAVRGIDGVDRRRRGGAELAEE